MSNCKVKRITYRETYRRMKKLCPTMNEETLAVETTHVWLCLNYKKITNNAPDLNNDNVRAVLDVINKLICEVRCV